MTDESIFFYLKKNLPLFLRRYFYHYFLRKELQHHVPERHSVKFEEAREIGLLFDATDVNQNSVITDFAAQLKALGKKVVMLAYFDSPKPALHFDFQYFNRKNLNWHLQPETQEVKTFLERRFDILINVFSGEVLPLEYIAMLSQACFRIGIYQPGKTQLNDLMVDVKGHTDLSHQLEQIRHYLKLV